MKIGRKRGQFNLGFENSELPSIAVIQLHGDYPLTKNPAAEEKNAIPIVGDQNEAPPAYDGIAETDTPQRDQWNNQIEFLLSCVSMSVGLGNIWRFPFIAYENGGGAFLIPYLIVLFVIGKPLYFMELAIGQFCSYGAVKLWKCVPFFKGIGFGQAISTFYVTTYYNAIMATCVFYFIMCFSSTLPWTTCDPWWGPNELCKDSNSNSTNQENGTDFSQNNTKNENPAQQFYERFVLRKSNGIDEMGSLDWRMALCLLFCWVTLFFILIKGIKSSGKTTYVTAIFPYLVLISLLILGCTLEGSGQGILAFVEPKWELLGNPQVWYKACEQSFFSLAVGFGNLAMFSSYNPFRHNVYKDAMIVSVLDTLTSLLAGFTIFAILGNMAHNLNLPVLKVVDSGVGLAFIAYPQALSGVVVPQLWNALFFLMLFILGIGSSVSQVSNVLTVIIDQFPHIVKWKAGLVICIFCYGIGLLYVTQGGQYIHNLIDSFGAGFTTFIFAAMQVIAIMWFYGMNRFCKDINFMLGRKMSWYWRICWVFIVPVGLGVIFIYSIANYEPPKLGDYVYPNYCIAIGWCISAIAIGQIPIWGFITVYKQKGDTLWEKFTSSFRPADDWGPRNPKDRVEWLTYH